MESSLDDNKRVRKSLEKLIGCVNRVESSLDDNKRVRKTLETLIRCVNRAVVVESSSMAV